MCEISFANNAIRFTPSKDEVNNTVFFVLHNLADNDYAIIDNDSFIVPFDNIFQLSLLEQKQLGLPLPYPYYIYIRQDGLINTSSFTFKSSFRKSINGNILKLTEQKGPFATFTDPITGTSETFTFTKEIYDVLVAVNEFNSLPPNEKTNYRNYCSFAEIKKISLECSSIILDNTILKREVVKPSKIGFDVDVIDDETVEIAPHVTEVNKDDFINAIDNNATRDLYNIISRDKTTSVVVNDEQRNIISAIKKNRRIKGRDNVKHFIDHPHDYIDSDDLAAKVAELKYSDRVKKFGIYEPVVTPFGNEFSSQWVVDDGINGRTIIKFSTIEELNEFSERIRLAEQNKQLYVLVYPSANECVEITIAQAKYIENASRRLFENQSDNNQPDFVEGVVLKDNIEKVDYSEPLDDIARKCNFEKNSNLQNGITLKAHQVEGIGRMQTLVRHKLNNQNISGFLLADDMGLGKTMQVLYFLDWHAQNCNSSNKPYLIVAPVSLLENWQNEYKRFFKSTMPIVNTSIPSATNSSFINLVANTKSILLTSYESMRNGQKNICAIDFAVVVLDEAQKIKTPSAMVTSVAKALQADFKLAMTGTPVENTFGDFWCIVDFIAPGHLGNARSFAQRFSTKGKSHDAIQKLGEELRDKVNDIFIRRLKEDVAKELPAKITYEHKEKMPAVQLEQYKRAINSVTVSETSSDILNRIHYIRSISDHPYIDIDTSEKPADELINSSAKMIVTFRLLNDIKLRREKAIIFAESRAMQVILQRTINVKFGILPRVINGQTPTTGQNVTRQRIIDEFQNSKDFNVIIMSPLAAGVGLNVTAANHVIHYSRHWNPAKESQATDRAYRIGQTREVSVYYPMAVTDEFKTFDQVLAELLNKKIALAKAVLFPSEMFEVSQSDIIEQLTSTIN